MSLDPTALESELRQLQPAALGESLLARLDACAGDSWVELDPAELAFEKLLRGISPSQLPAGLTATLEAALAGVRFPNEEKIVPFPKSETTTPRHSRGWWSAAAAVAITGAITAFLVPMNHDKGIVAASPPKSGLAPLPSNNKLIPAGFNRGLSEASDEGVIWQNNNRPHRVLKVVYRDRVTLKDAQGATYQVEQPRVEYILVPAKTD
jgi:hypothetical protein